MVKTVERSGLSKLITQDGGNIRNSRNADSRKYCMLFGLPRGTCPLPPNPLHQSKLVAQIAVRANELAISAPLGLRQLAVRHAWPDCIGHLHYHHFCCFLPFF